MRLTRRAKDFILRFKTIILGLVLIAAFLLGSGGYGKVMAQRVDNSALRREGAMQLQEARRSLNVQTASLARSQTPLTFSTCTRSSNEGGATAIVIDCTSSTAIGQEECLDRAMSFQAQGCSCGSIEGGTSCECPEGDD
jgi:hypothetical protein